MKLMCQRHGKRVMVLPNGKQLHRDKGDVCKSPVKMGPFNGKDIAVLRTVVPTR